MSDRRNPFSLDEVGPMRGVAKPRFSQEQLDGESTTKVVAALSLRRTQEKLLAITQRHRLLLHFRDGRRRAPEHRYAGRYA